MELAGLALQPENRRFFARKRGEPVMGAVLRPAVVHPLDQMHSSNPPSHPELLDWLERDFVEHGYDVQRLIRGIVLSETYARSSAWTNNGPTPDPDSFAVMAVRPLTPRELSYRCRSPPAIRSSSRSIWSRQAGSATARTSKTSRTALRT